MSGSTHALSPLFTPASVAVIGASSDPDRIGGRVLRFLIEAGYQGRLYPVNRSGAAEIQGLPAFASITDVPGTVDQAIVLTPVAGVEVAIRDSIAKGVKCVLVLTAGFAEIGPEGRALQDRLRDMCRAAGVRMVGPNSLGMLNLDNRYFATFSTVLYGLQPRKGRIALATQSGAFGSCAYGMASLRGMGFSQIVATGNEADVDVAECIDWFAQDPGTDVICAALESCRDGRRLRAALLKAAAAGKPVLVMKVGRTELGAAAASTHTGSLAGNDAAFDAVFAECGALRPSSIEEMLDIAWFCAVTGRLPANNDMGVVTGSGGIGVLMADQAGESGITMSPLMTGIIGLGVYSGAMASEIYRAGIEGIVDQFAHHGGWALDHFTRCNLANQHIGEFTNGSSGLGLAHPQIVGVPAPGLAPTLKGQKTGIIGPWTP